MGFFQDFYKNVIAPTSKAVGTSGFNPGKQALDINQRLADQTASQPRPKSFFDAVGQAAGNTANFTKEFAKFGYQNSEPGFYENIIGHVGAQLTGKPFSTPIEGEHQSYTDTFKNQGAVAGALTLGGDILGARGAVKTGSEVGKAAVSALPATTAHAGFFDTFKPSEVAKNETKSNASIAQANRPTNETNTAKVVEDTLAGNREDVRLSQPKVLQIAKDYPANKLSAEATPNTQVTVYRAGTGTVAAGDHVTLSEAQANKYATQREGSTVTSTQVPLKDLVRSEGLKSEFIYAPKEGAPNQPPTGVDGGKVFYHGTNNADLKNLSDLKSGRNIGKSSTNMSYITENPEIARNFGSNVISGRVYGKHLNVRDLGNPFDSIVVPKDFADYQTNPLLSPRDRRVFENQYLRGQADNRIIDATPDIHKYLVSKGYSTITVPRVHSDVNGARTETVIIDPKATEAPKPKGTIVPTRQVSSKDLVQSGGLKDESIYSPKTGAPAGGEAASRLIAALGEAKPGVAQIEKAQSVELGKRAGAGAKALETYGGEKGFAAAKKTLQGPLLSEKPTTITTKLQPNDLNELYGQIEKHPQLRFFEKIRAYDALNKVFEGKVPQRAELGLLQNVFGPKLTEAVLKNRSKWEKVRATLTDLANIPRAIRSTLDFSAPFRQGLVLTAAHPFKASDAYNQMFRQVFSPKNHDAWFEDLKNSPKYERLKDAGLYIADPKDISGGLAAKEEAFMGDLIHKIPFIKQTIGAVVRSGERAYVGYLNEIRTSVFNDLADKLESIGEGPGTLKALAKFVNVATGRGELGALEKIAPELNTVFFAPRNMAARINMLNPAWYAKLPKPVRKEAIKSAAILVGTGLSILGLAKMAGATVESDPRSTDFGKIRLGTQRWDIWGGFQQYARFIAQELTGQQKTDQGVAKSDRVDTAVKFARSKLAPIPAAVVDIAKGTQYTGQPTTPGSVATNLVSPFIAQDIANSVQQQGPSGILSAAPAVFGVGVQNYTPKTTSATSRIRRSGGTGLKKSKSPSRTRKGRTAKISKTRVSKGRSTGRVKTASVRIKRGKKL